MAAAANSNDECLRALIDAHEVVESVETIVDHFVSWAADARKAGALCSVTEAALHVIHTRLHDYIGLVEPTFQPIAMEDLDTAALEDASTWLYSIADTFAEVFQEDYELDAFGDACMCAVKTMCFSAASALDRAFGFGQRVSPEREAA